MITRALLVARDGDDALLAALEAWVREVIGIALEEKSDRGGSCDTLPYNRPAIAILALIHLWARWGKPLIAMRWSRSRHARTGRQPPR